MARVFAGKGRDISDVLIEVLDGTAIDLDIYVISYRKLILRLSEKGKLM